MITDKIQLRPRYGEVDQMGYVYHANHVSYCHQARTELMRKLGVNDNALEATGIMLPVVSFNINYKNPARYDELLTIKTTIKEMPEVVFNFEFEITNEQGKPVSLATSTICFVDSKTRFPMEVPEFITNALLESFKNGVDLSA